MDLGVSAPQIPDDKAMSVDVIKYLGLIGSTIEFAFPIVAQKITGVSANCRQMFRK
jgi:hypothetical protein